MKVMVIYPYGCLGAAWSCTRGITDTLTRMGYEVVDWPINYLSGVISLPNIKDLASVGGVIVSGMEHMFSLFDRHAAWHRAPVPKAIMYHESVVRDDARFNVEGMMKLADYHFFPSAHDAKTFGGVYLPFGVDTEMFRDTGGAIRYQTGFIGSMYPKREEYIKKTGLDIPLVTGMDVALPNGQMNIPASTQKLVEGYNSIEVFINLPSLSRLLVTKVYEVMACGRFLFTPLLKDMGEENMHPFQNGFHLEYYDEDKPQELRERVESVLNNGIYRTAVETNGRVEVHTKHRLDQRLAIVMEKLING